MSLDWSGAQISAILGDIGIIAGLFFTGFGVWRDARVRRGETLIEITKLHRELWIYYDEHPELAGLFAIKRDMTKQPLTEAELRFANFLFLHMRASFGANKARIHALPEHLAEDWREAFSHPALLAAWNKMKRLHDRQFVAVVEAFRQRAQPY